MHDVSIHNNHQVSTLSVSSADTIETLMRQLELHADEGLALTQDSKKHLPLNECIGNKGELFVVDVGLPCPVGHVMQWSSFHNSYWSCDECNRSCTESGEDRWTCAACIGEGGCERQFDICQGCGWKWRSAKDSVTRRPREHISTHVQFFSTTRPFKNLRDKIRVARDPLDQVVNNIVQRNTGACEPALLHGRNCIEVPDEVICGAVARARSHGGRAVARINEWKSEHPNQSWAEYDGPRRSPSRPRSPSQPVEQRDRLTGHGCAKRFPPTQRGASRSRTH